jgi:hypothetical protein
MVFFCLTYLGENVDMSERASGPAREEMLDNLADSSLRIANGLERPVGRWRMSPAIPATPYSRYIPPKPYKISRAHHAAEWIRYALNRRPDTEEVAEWVMEHGLEIMYVSSAVITVGAVAVYAVDQVFNLGLADSMAHVRVDPHTDSISQTLQEVVHDIGTAAGGNTK